MVRYDVAISQMKPCHVFEIRVLLFEIYENCCSIHLQPGKQWHGIIETLGSLQSRPQRTRVVWGSSFSYFTRRFCLGGGLQQIIQNVLKNRTQKQHMWLSYRSSNSRNDRYYGPRTANQKPKFDPPRNDLPQYSGPIGIPGQRDQLSWCNQCVRIKFGQLGNIPSMLAK